MIRDNLLCIHFNKPSDSSCSYFTDNSASAFYCCKLSESRVFIMIRRLFETLNFLYKMMLDLESKVLFYESKYLDIKKTHFKSTIKLLTSRYVYVKIKFIPKVMNLNIKER